MEASKKRLQGEFNFQMRRVINENDSSFMHGCGYVLRNDSSLQYKEWRYVPNEVRFRLRHKLIVWLFYNSIWFEHNIYLMVNYICWLKTLFDIDLENSSVCKVIDSYMAKAWRGYRSELHADFKDMGTWFFLLFWPMLVVRLMFTFC